MIRGITDLQSSYLKTLPSVTGLKTPLQWFPGALMSLLCVAPSHLSICIAALSPSLKHRVSSHRFPSHQPPYLPPPSCSFPSSPKLTSSTPPNHLRLSAVRSKYQDMGYLTHHWSCWSASPAGRLTEADIHADTHTHLHVWLMLSKRFMCSVFKPEYLW